MPMQGQYTLVGHTRSILNVTRCVLVSAVHVWT